LKKARNDISSSISSFYSPSSSTNTNTNIKANTNTSNEELITLNEFVEVMKKSQPLSLSDLIFKFKNRLGNDKNKVVFLFFIYLFIYFCRNILEDLFLNIARLRMLTSLI
jgi:hypothetical protein